MSTEPVASDDAEAILVEEDMAKADAVRASTTDAPAGPRPPASSLAEADVLQVIPRRPGGSLPPPDSSQDLSLAPMGIDSLARLPLDAANSTGSISVSIASRRKRLTRIVVAAIAACGVILVAAGIAHAVRRSDDPPPVAAAPPPAPDPVPPADAPAVAPAPDNADTVDVSKTKGTVHLDKPAAPGKVWLDGKKLSKVETLVACGKHQIKVGARARAHALDVPCGGEVHVSR